MTSRLLLGVALLLSGCWASAAPSHRALMDEIERGLRLPPGTRTLDGYVRYYAAGPKGTIIGVYLALPMVGDLKTGDRRWLDNRRSLPGVNDGGCSVVNVEFNLATRKSTAFCNGLA